MLGSESNFIINQSFEKVNLYFYKNFKISPKIRFSQKYPINC